MSIHSNDTCPGPENCVGDTTPDICPGPDICLSYGSPAGSCPGQDICYTSYPSPDGSCLGPDVCFKFTPSGSCPGPSQCFLSVSSGHRDTVHYLSPVSSRSRSPSAYLRYLQKCNCGEAECICDEYESIRYTDVSSDIYAEILERTVAIIKPTAVCYEDVIERVVLKEGFQILQKKHIHLTPEQASEFFSPHYGKVYFPYYVVSMSEGPIVVMCLAAVNAVAKWREVIGANGTLKMKWFWPKSMRYRFGIQQNMDNVIYGSTDLETANREIRFFFPQMILEPLLSEEKGISDYLRLRVNPTLSKGLAEVVKRKPLEPIIFLGEWLLVNNPYQPKLNPDIAKLPT